MIRRCRPAAGRLTCALTLILAMVGSAPACAGNDALVLVGDMPITHSDLATALRRSGLDHQPSEQLRQTVAASMLERLIDEQLLRAAVTDAAIRIDPAIVNQVIEQVRARKPPAGGSALPQMPGQVGGDDAALRRQIELDLGLRALIAPQLDENAIAVAFEKHRHDIDGRRVRISHVILRPNVPGDDGDITASLREAGAIRAAIVSGTLSFAEAAAIHSVGPSRHRGGDIGFLSRNGEAHEAFIREAFALEVGEISRPFITPFGIHLVTVTDVEPGTATLATVRPQVERLAAQDAIRELLVNLRQTTPITYLSGAAITAPGKMAPSGESAGPKPD